MRLLHTEHDLAPFHSGRFIPTMGALHEGHASLIRAAVADRDAGASHSPVIVSIFVNPTQFNDPADLKRYPRTPEADAAICQAAGVDAIFAPDVTTIYPPALTIPTPPLPLVATTPMLEDALRPGHFAGVCQVVQRLFDLVRPARAYFGEKDWQQLQVISAMTAANAPALASPRIIPVPTIRESDGLAMSSRNRFIPPEDRARSATIWRALRAAQSHTDIHAAHAAMTDALKAADLEIQYAVIRDAATLGPVKPGHPARALIAVKLGPVRLIDNAPWHT
jgi:pantoate--beta-alanine ligase